MPTARISPSGRGRKGDSVGRECAIAPPLGQPLETLRRAVQELRTVALADAAGKRRGGEATVLAALELVRAPSAVKRNCLSTTFLTSLLRLR